MAKIGLVTVLFKSDDVLDGFFKSIALQDYKNYILYLIDNSPSETSDKIISDCIQQYAITEVRHIKSNGNIGVAAGNNAGIKQALADNCSHILILNNDIEMDQPVVFSNLLSDSEKGIAPIVVPKIFYYPGKKLWMAGGYMNKWRALGIHYGMNEDDSPQFDTPKHISYAPTCFMLIKKEVFDKTGFMDEKYFAYYDDTDFVLRAMQSGFSLYYDPSVFILHKVSFSAGSDSLFYVYYSNRNKIYFIKKNLHGFQKYFALAYTLVARIFFWLKYDKERRKKLIQGLKDGFRLAIN